jgi:hypothetical protein
MKSRPPKPGANVEVTRKPGPAPSSSVPRAAPAVAKPKGPGAAATRPPPPAPDPAVLEARSTISNAPVEEYLRRVIAGRVELTVTTDKETLNAVLTKDDGTRFVFDPRGEMRKLRVIFLAPHSASGRYVPTSIDPALAPRPASVADQPQARPVFDPRPFVPHVGKLIEATLRNGMTFRLPLVAVGRFDLLMGTSGEELFVPLHAVLSWHPATGQ